MRLLIVRHGDPNYDIDGLTEKGEREVAALADRMAREDVAKICCSPLGRARLTAQPSADRLGLGVEICPWLREFEVAHVPIHEGASKKCCWDLFPSFMEENPLLYHPTRWREVDCFKNTDFPAMYDDVCRGLDEKLAEFGYVRDGLNYRVERETHDTLMLVCHFGVTSVLLSHLMNCSPCSIWQHVCTLPSSVSVLYTEERVKGIAAFRASAIGDTSHLFAAGEPLSFAARWCECFSDDTRH